MARTARQISEINSYTIILKANIDIQFNSHDKDLFLDIVSKYSPILNYKFLAYNLSDTVLTFVVYDSDTAIDIVMRKIMVSFVSKFNLYHNHKGKVFKDRFLSLPAHSVKDVWDMVYDVHNLSSCEYNSVNNYYDNQYINIQCVKQFYGSEENFNKAVINRNNPESLKSKIVKTKINDAELVAYITKEVMPIEELKKLPKNKLTTLLKDIIDKTSASARQIARITSFPLRMLWNLGKDKSYQEEKKWVKKYKKPEKR